MNTQQSVEHVLVVPTERFHDIGYFQGFSDDPEPYLNSLFDPLYTSYRPRNEVEEDPGFKQLIPYCIFRCGELVYSYFRGTSQGEGRLHSKRSIGVGGHISADDENGESCAYREGMQRELREEVFIESDFKESCVGLLNDDETEVGRVHLGIIHIFDLDYPKVRAREASMMDAGFTNVRELLQNPDQFETWSAICLKHLFSN